MGAGVSAAVGGKAAEVLTEALRARRQPMITPGQGQAIRSQTVVAAPACGCFCHVFGGHHVASCCGYAPPLEDPDGGRRGD